MEARRLSGRRHRALRRALEAYLDDEATAVVAMEVRRHLERCWACSEDAEWLLLMKAALQRLGHHRPPELAVLRLERLTQSLLAAP